jgi:hypothetical protein
VDPANWELRLHQHDVIPLLGQVLEWQNSGYLISVGAAYENFKELEYRVSCRDKKTSKFIPSPAGYRNSIRWCVRDIMSAESEKQTMGGGE